MIAMNEILLKRIKELREEKDISQRQLQRDLGMSPSTITKWKTSNPSATTLQAVAEYFNVTVDYLNGKTNYRNKEHMLQVFDQNFTPDLDNKEVPFDLCVQTEEGIMMVEAKTPKYIDPATRRVAEKIMTSDKLEYIFQHLTNMSESKIDAIYNMVKAME